MANLTYPRAVNNAVGVPSVQITIFDNPTLTGALAGGGAGGDAITLFMPPAFQIQDSHDYEFKKGGAGTQLLQFGANALSNGSSGLIGAGYDALAYIANKVGKGIGLEGSDEFAAAASGFAVRDPKFFNYKEPKPREFTFNFKFEPKNSGDAEQMMAVIARLRLASYPTLLGTKVYGVPSAVTISFLNFNSTMPETSELMVIKEVNTTLSEGDQVLTFDDGTPTQVGLQLQLAETRLITKQGGVLGGAQT